MADRLTMIVVSLIAVAAPCLVLSPLNYGLVEPYRLSGRIIEWRWVRRFSPFINLYAVVFLVGGARSRRGATGSAWRRITTFVGNVCIAVGALLPGIGGTFNRFGLTEVLYVTELVGLVLIIIIVGYRFNIAKPSGVLHAYAPPPVTG